MYLGSTRSILSYKTNPASKIATAIDCLIPARLKVKLPIVRYNKTANDFPSFSYREMNVKTGRIIINETNIRYSRGDRPNSFRHKFRYENPWSISLRK